MKEKKYLAYLHKIGIEQKKFFLIFEQKQSYKQFFEQLNYTSLRKLNYPDKKINEILQNKEELGIEYIDKVLLSFNVNIILYNEKAYPENLKHISNPPFLLYVRGNISLPGIAFVGSRNITSYGKSVIEKLIPEVGKYFTIISGGAAGCDTYSHFIALKNNFKTISVIGTGIDKNYPVENKKLFNQIVENHGAVISIFPIGEPGLPFNFPIRNEIVAGLSSGVVLIEAKEKSGTLITAKLGLDQSKEVFAIPGDITKSNSLGCNRAILNGEAKIVLEASDILSEFNIKLNTPKEKNEIIFNDDLEKQIYNILLIESFNLDELAEKLDTDISYILLKISILELSGLIKKANSGKYEII